MQLALHTLLFKAELKVELNSWRSETLGVMQNSWEGAGTGRGAPPAGWMELIYLHRTVCAGLLEKLGRSPRFIMEYRPTVIRTSVFFYSRLLFFCFILWNDGICFAVAVTASLCWLLFMEPSPYCRAICFPYCPGIGLSSINYWLLLSFQLFLFVQRAASKASSSPAPFLSFSCSFMFLWMPQAKTIVEWIVSCSCCWITGLIKWTLWGR